MDFKRRITIPTILVKTKPGQTLDVPFDAEDALISRQLPEREDWLEVLAACPIAMGDLPDRRAELPRRRKL